MIIAFKIVKILTLLFAVFLISCLAIILFIPVMFIIKIFSTKSEYINQEEMISEGMEFDF